MRKWALLSVVIACCASCGTPQSSSGPSASIEGNVLSVDLGGMTVPAGDTLTCISTGFVTDREYAIGRPMGEQMPGGHHLALYWVDDATTFEPRRCTEQDMIDWNLIASAGQEGGMSDRSLPDGLAFRLPAGVHIVIQMHYINATGAPLDVHDRMRVNLLDPSTIMGYAGLYAINDGAFEIPAHTNYRRVSECTVTAPLDIVLMVGHMHENGANFSLDYIPAATGMAETMYAYEWMGVYASHPPVRRWATDAPLHLSAGDRFVMTCEWRNTHDTSLLFPEEMCVTSTYYFPEVGDGLIVCDSMRTLASESF